MPDTLFTTDAMRDLFSARASVQRMLDFEAALARAESSVGVIPPQAASLIAAQCDARQYAIDELHAAARTAGNLAIPLVAALTAKVAATSEEARGCVHWGATSQDVLDTALMLQLRDAFALLDADLARLGAALRMQIGRHRGTVLAGRTLLQQATPVTLALKFAGVLDATERHRRRLAGLLTGALALQFGGASGTLASLGRQALAVETALAEELRLPVAAIPWHTQRDRLGEVATTLGLLTATLGKLARDIAMLSQSEVGEAAEAAMPGRGGSSTMPQKRNPVDASIALAAAVRVPGLVATMLAAAVQEHERGLGTWPAEWETLPGIVLLAAGALEAMADAVEGLEIDVQRMRANVDLTQGRIMAEAVQMALAPALGRDAAHELVASACRRAQAERLHLRDVLADLPQVTSRLDAAELDAILEPAHYLGVADAFVDRVINH